MEKDVLITKASGEVAKFSEQKLRHSLERSGAAKEQIDEIVNEVSGKLYPEISTKERYQIAFDLLKEKFGYMAAIYMLNEISHITSEIKIQFLGAAGTVTGVHAVFASGAYEELVQAGASAIITCNTIPHPSYRIDISELIIAALTNK
jgi:hypothetical protein